MSFTQALVRTRQMTLVTMASDGNQHGTVLALDEVLHVTAQYAKLISSETNNSSTVTGPTNADTEALRQRSVASTAFAARSTLADRQSQILACVRWLVKLNILSYIPRTGGISYIRLASIARVPLSQLRSVVRMVITSGFLSETQPSLVHHSDLSSLLAYDPSVMNWSVARNDSDNALALNKKAANTVCLRRATWLTDYSVPTAYKFSEATVLWGHTSAKDQTAFSLAVDEKMPFFDYLGRNIDVAKMFSSYMRQVSLISGTDSDHLVDNFDWSRLPPGSTIVDLGGSRGHTSLALARKNSHVKFVVQDLREVITDAAQAIQAEDPGISSEGYEYVT
ncbi:hypothetical protein AC579_5012 [Pseudocercospora musae]|uniref:O-methyltransferase C-terminal domain-containing protein n=1 Tax=Pseudocercospora musae TaxID=113226 RepID=A0A139I8Q7_9PEZI|nr:hypothetical protein AC579_5012 [Pseudocercospora musae]